MQAIKTAISIEKKLFDQAEIIARTMKVSRSRLFAIALQDFIEQALRKKVRRQHRRIVEGEW
jgi:metal-responsive CopG/Arc/MetJ family transcriptional regulator